MQFLAPVGAVSLAALAAIIVLYLLRRQRTRLEVSSLLLWRRVMEDYAASRPFQKLKRNVLLLLQLAAALAMGLALMRPALPGGLSGETVLILDASMSMQADVGGEPRIAQARAMAVRLIASLPEGDAVTVIEAGSRVNVRATRTTDHTLARRAAESVEAGNAGADMAGAVSLAQAMARQAESVTIIVLSDDYEPPKGVYALRVGEGADNRAVLSLEAAETASGWRAVARVANYGADCDISLSCRADGELCDVRSLSLAEDETGSVSFTLPGEPSRVIVTIDGRDALANDDARYWVGRASYEPVIALVGDRENVFLESALRLVDGARIVRGDAPDQADLFVYDGALPEQLPDTGALLCVNTGAGVNGIACSETAAGQAVLPASGMLAASLLDELSFEQVALRAYTPLTGGQPILLSGSDVIAAASEADGRRAAVLGFDLHDSNLPLKYDFPLLLCRLAAWLMPESAVSVENAECGQQVPLTPDARALEAAVITPSGRRVPVALAGEAFSETDEIGVYTLNQILESETRVTAFTLHGAAAESDVRRIAAQHAPDAASGAARGAGREMTAWLIAAALLLLIVEWGVSRRVA